MILLQLNWIWMSLIAALFVGMAPVLLKNGLKKSSVLVSTAVSATAFLVTGVIIGSIIENINLLDGMDALSLLKLIGFGALCLVLFVLALIALDRGTVIQAVIALQFFYIVPLVVGAITSKRMLDTKECLFVGLVIAGVVLAVFSESSDRLWVVFALGAVIAYLIMNVYKNKFLVGMNANAVQTIPLVVAVVASWIILVIRGEGNVMKKMTVFNGLFLILAGVILAFALVLEARALGVGDVKMVSSLVKLSLPIAMLLSLAFLKEKLNSLKVAALVLVLVADYMFIMG